MYNFKGILVKFSIGTLITILIFMTGNLIVNNLIIYRSESENIVCTINEVNKKRLLNGKTYTYRYEIYTEELDEAVLNPRDLIKEMYQDKDKYIGKKIDVVKISNYNRKNELIGISYELR